jgi:hypothetical protein
VKFAGDRQRVESPCRPLWGAVELLGDRGGVVERAVAVSKKNRRSSSEAGSPVSP